MVNVIVVGNIAGSGGRVEYTQKQFTTNDGGTFVTANNKVLFVKSRKR